MPARPGGLHPGQDYALSHSSVLTVRTLGLDSGALQWLPQAERRGGLWGWGCPHREAGDDVVLSEGLAVVLELAVSGLLASAAIAVGKELLSCQGNRGDPDEPLPPCPCLTFPDLALRQE